MLYWKVTYRQPSSPSGLAVSYKFAESEAEARKLAEKGVGRKLDIVEAKPQP